MRMILALLLNVLFIMPVISATGYKHPVEFVDSKFYEFNPSLKQSHTFPIKLNEDARIKLDIYSPDGEKVWRFDSIDVLKVGLHDIIWNGFDDDNQLVPDEAYHPVLTVEINNKVTVVDPRIESGGEIVSPLIVGKQMGSQITYALPAPSRVLVRAGVKNGPVMRSIARWVPKAPGSIVHRWDGYDDSGAEKISVRDDFWVLVKAYQLPKHTVITTGNKKINYRKYRDSRGWSVETVNLKTLNTLRKGVRLEKDYFLPRGFEPSIQLNMIGVQDQPTIGLPKVSGTVRFEVNVPFEDRWVLDSGMYEIVYFIDYQFIAEEEQGFVPFVFEYNMNTLTPGRHIITAQITGYAGYFVSRTIAFENVSKETIKKWPLN